MDIDKLIEFCKKKGDEGYHGMIARSHGVMVTRPAKEGGEHIINYFLQEKDAKAFCFHAYGKSAWECRKDGIKIAEMSHYTPTPGDFVLYDGSGQFDAMTRLNTGDNRTVYKGGYGYLCGAFNQPPSERIDLIFNTYGIFRDEISASGSGGPMPRIETAELTLIGFTTRSYERWYEGIPQKDGMGWWQMTVPMWRWSGNTKPE